MFLDDLKKIIEYYNLSVNDIAVEMLRRGDLTTSSGTTWKQHTESKQRTTDRGLGNYIRSLLEGNVDEINWWSKNIPILQRLYEVLKQPQSNTKDKPKFERLHATIKDDPRFASFDTFKMFLEYDTKYKDCFGWQDYPAIQPFDLVHEDMADTCLWNQLAHEEFGSAHILWYVIPDGWGKKFLAHFLARKYKLESESAESYEDVKRKLYDHSKQDRSVVVVLEDVSDLSLQSNIPRLSPLNLIMDLPDNNLSSEKALQEAWGSNPRVNPNKKNSSNVRTMQEIFMIQDNFAIVLTPYYPPTQEQSEWHIRVFEPYTSWRHNFIKWVCKRWQQNKYDEYFYQKILWCLFEIDPDEKQFPSPQALLPIIKMCYEQGIDSFKSAVFSEKFLFLRQLFDHAIHSAFSVPLVKRQDAQDNDNLFQQFLSLLKTFICDPQYLLASALLEAEWLKIAGTICNTEQRHSRGRKKSSTKLAQNLIEILKATKILHPYPGEKWLMDFGYVHIYANQIIPSFVQELIQSTLPNISQSSSPDIAQSNRPEIATWYQLCLVERRQYIDNGLDKLNDNEFNQLLVNTVAQFQSKPTDLFITSAIEFFFSATARRLEKAYFPWLESACTEPKNSVPNSNITPIFPASNNTSHIHQTSEPMFEQLTARTIPDLLIESYQKLFQAQMQLAYAYSPDWIPLPRSRRHTLNGMLNNCEWIGDCWIWDLSGLITHPMIPKQAQLCFPINGKPELHQWTKRLHDITSQNAPPGGSGGRSPKKDSIDPAYRHYRRLTHMAFWIIHKIKLDISFVQNTPLLFPAWLLDEILSNKTPCLLQYAYLCNDINKWDDFLVRLVLHDFLHLNINQELAQKIATHLFCEMLKAHAQHAEHSCNATHAQTKNAHNAEHDTWPLLNFFGEMWQRRQRRLIIFFEDYILDKECALAIEETLPLESILSSTQVSSDMYEMTQHISRTWRVRILDMLCMSKNGRKFLAKYIDNSWYSSLIRENKFLVSLKKDHWESIMDELIALHGSNTWILIQNLWKFCPELAYEHAHKHLLEESDVAKTWVLESPPTQAEKLGKAMLELAKKQETIPSWWKSWVLLNLQNPLMYSIVGDLYKFVADL